jgi:hypothetical protein
VKGVGKPCKGEPYARIDGGGWKRKRPGHGHHGWDDPAGNRGNADPGTYHRMTPPRLPPTLHRYGHSTVRFGKIRNYALERLTLFIGKRHKRGRGFGLSVVAYLSPDQCGLVSLTGIVAAPRAGKPWREKPNAGGERRR